MATSKRANDNYIHSCGLEQTEIDTKIMSISKMNFTSEQVVAIIEFFLFFDLSRSATMDGLEHRQ